MSLSVTFISYSYEHTFVIYYFVLCYVRVAASHFVIPVHRMLSHLDYQNRVSVELEYSPPMQSYRDQMVGSSCPSLTKILLWLL